jgi:hypothetical protein
MPERLKRFLLVTVCIALAAAAMISAWRGVGNALEPEGSRDFSWTSIRTLAEGDNPYAVYLGGERPGWVRNEDGHFFFPNYPITVYGLLLPFGWIPWQAAAAAWAAVNLLAAVAVVLLLRSIAAASSSSAHVRAYHWVFLGALFFCSTPVRDILSNGQFTLVSLACFLGSMRLALSERALLSGVVLAFAWIKFTVTIPLTLWFLCRKKWIEAGVALAVHVAVGLAISLVTRTSPLELFSQFCTMAKDTFALEAYRDNASSLSDIASALSPTGGFSWILPPLFLVLAYFVIRQAGRRSDLWILALLTLPATLAWAHLRYDQCALVLPLAFVSAGTANAPLRALAGTLIAAQWYLPRIIERQSEHLPPLLEHSLAALTWLCWLAILVFLLRLPRTRND